MITGTTLNRLISSAIQTASRDSAPIRRRTRRTALQRSDITEVIEFLHSPYELGHWELQAQWIGSSALSIFLLGRLDTLSALGDAQDERLNIVALRRRLPEDKLEEMTRVTSNLSSINTLFQYSIELLEGDTRIELEVDDIWIESIEPSELKAKFPEAWDVFKKEIMPSYDGDAVDDGFLQGDNGLAYIFSWPKDRAIEFISTQKSTVDVWKRFYEALGFIKTAAIQRVFAPDEALFKPYFAFVSAALPRLIDDDRSYRTFAQSLDYYKADDFQHCISTLGLIAEDYLQRIYTTLLREPLASGLTLGQTIDRINTRIQDLYPSARQSLGALDTLYEKINAVNALNAAELQSVLRDIVSNVKDDRNYFSRRIDEITKPQQRKQIFPKKIQENLNEMLRWRNAASHNSRIPLGAHEADRTLFCLICLVNWWQGKVNSLDWTKTKIELVDVLIQDAKIEN